MKHVTMLMVALLAFGGCKKKGGGDGAGAAMAKMSEFKDEMCKCKDAKCAQDVSDKMAKWNQDEAKKSKESVKMSDADQQKAAALGEELGKCMQTAMTAPATPEGSAADPAAGSAGSAGSAVAGDGLPPECADYKAQVEKLKTCDKLPIKAKDALIKAFNDASAGWANMPEGAKQGLNTSCKAGTEAVVVAAKEACGW
jgi:hypothetical protein